MAGAAAAVMTAAAMAAAIDTRFMISSAFR
jgi:hypothetical protein